MALPFDIETIADPTAVAMLDPIRPQANLKDPAKIEANIAERTQARLDKLALDPACNRIVAIGCGSVVTVCPDIDVEREALRNFWTAWVEYPGAKTGYNVIGFDMPTLITRSRILRVPHPTIFLKKWGTAGIVDLMLDLNTDGEYRSLGFWCRRLGLDVPIDKTSGKDIAAMVAANDWDGVVTHCLIDLKKTQALYDRIHSEPTDTDDVF
jgi:hypothetical protein